MTKMTKKDIEESFLRESKIDYYTKVEPLVSKVISYFRTSFGNNGLTFDTRGSTLVQTYNRFCYLRVPDVT
jgi:hypothetical protein